MTIKDFLTWWGQNSDSAFGLVAAVIVVLVVFTTCAVNLIETWRGE